MDIRDKLDEAEYVNILLGNNFPGESKCFDKSDPDVFLKTIIEDCGRDIFAHADILKIKPGI